MRASLLIPVKNLNNAKQRLGEVLEQSQRAQLAEAMLRDVMNAAAGVTDRLDVFLVTGDLRARAIAAEFHFGVIEDIRAQGVRHDRRGAGRHSTDHKRRTPSRARRRAN